MTKREKVFRGLECCSQMVGEVCRKCPYANECEEGEGLLAGSAHLAADALSLLKAQEPIEPIELYDDTKCVEDYNRTLAWKCGKCGYYIGGADNFCANCGQAVKWNE